jgi:phytoene dehydrogenase-like protein
MTDKYDVIVIGAGHNGLTTAAYLARAGAKVLVVERRHETGGGLVTEEFSGFRFNLHAIYMMMLDVAPPYADLGLEADGCVYIRPPAELSLLLENGKSLTLYSDLEKSVESINRFSAKDAKRFREVYLEYKAMSDEILIPSTYAKPLAPTDIAEGYMKSEIGKKLLHISEMTPKEICDSWGFETKELSALLLYVVCMWGIDPEDTNSSYLVPLYFNRMLNATLVRGGSHRLSSTLQKAGILAGMTVMENYEVKRILVENGVATGIEAAPTNTEGPVVRVEGKAVVTSTDPVTTFGHLIPPDALGEKSKQTRATVKNWEWETTSFFGCHLGLRKRPTFKAEAEDPGVRTSLIKAFGFESPEEVVDHFREVAEGKTHEIGHVTITTEIDPHQGPIAIDPDCAVVRIEACVPYAPAEGDWDEIGKAYGSKIIAKLAEYTTGVDPADIVRRYDYSPKFIEQKIPQMKRGSFKHGAYIVTQMGASRPNIQCSSYKTPIKHLYVNGASTFPGGMVIFGAGYNAANVVAEDLGLKKWWKEPESVTEARKKGYVE